ncbi:hypothetical protein ABZ434_23100 [Streptomyces sp. NPDC005761]|uniref:hypothetical protein n=1 Tax=unclassified Streptomyces TaxID=2593676 RepID=UPI003410A0E0
MDTRTDRIAEPWGGCADDRGVTLLRELQGLHLRAAATSLCWEMPARAAQASRDQRLLSLVSTCHPEPLRQMKGSNTMLNDPPPQLLTQQ